MNMSSKCKVNIYERQTNVKQLSIDSLPLRTRVNKRKVYYDKPASSKCKCMHICIDRFDNARQLATFNMRQVSVKETPAYYYLDVKNCKVRKLKELAGANIDYKYVVHCRKSIANRKLEKLIAR